MEQNLLSRDCITRKMAKQSVFYWLWPWVNFDFTFKFQRPKMALVPENTEDLVQVTELYITFFAPDCLY